MPKGLDAEIDRLYQLPLNEFTAARNALAKEAGSDGGAIRQLAKPPLPAWAVNQLYWNSRDTYESLVDAAEQMRKTHKAVIEGKRGDLRSAGREHELAVDKALKATLDLMNERGQPVTEASRHAILNTLRALPADDPPGRLSRALTPGGFEMLAGVKPKPRSAAAQARGSVSPHARGSGAKARAGGSDREAAKEQREQAKRRAERDAAERALRDAEHRARQAEFETARTVRDAAKAEKRLAETREALDQAREEAADAERAAAAADRAREAAERKARDAESAVEAAKRALAEL